MWSLTGAGRGGHSVFVGTASCPLHMSRTCLPTTVCLLASSPAPAAMHWPACSAASQGTCHRALLTLPTSLTTLQQVLLEHHRGPLLCLHAQGRAAAVCR